MTWFQTKSAIQFLTKWLEKISISSSWASKYIYHLIHCEFWDWPSNFNFGVQGPPGCMNKVKVVQCCSLDLEFFALIGYE